MALAAPSIELPRIRRSDSEGGAMKSKAGIAVAAVLAAATLAACATGPAYESNAEAVDDATVAANVKAALLQDPETRGSNISVNTLHDQVELTGFVNSRQEADEAEHDARNVAGVRSVDDKLQINGGGPVLGRATDDRTISENVRSALASNPETENSRIQVTTSEGVVQLAGFVNTEDQRAAAGSVASSVQGVRHVDNDLRLNPAD
jgi:hyperosmotically inducible periplasmic protein